MNKNSWKIKRLGEISELQSGNGFPVEFQGKTEGDYPFAKVGDISNIARSGYHLISDANHWIDKDVIRKIKARVFPEGSIVFAKIGEAIKQNFRVISSCPMLFDNNVMGIKPNNCIIDTEYLFFYLKQVDFYGLSEKTTVPSIRKSKIETLEIPLPSLEEQKRIAAILDKADQVRRKRQEAIRLTEELGRSIFLDMFGDPVTNPKGWEVVKIDQIVDAIESGWSPKCDSRIAEPNEWGVLKLGAISWGTFNEQENKALLSGTTPKTDLEVQPGNLLFTRKNTYELVGASVYVDKTRSRLLLPDLVFRLKVNNKVNPIYLWQALSQSSMRQEISSLAGGSSGSMPNISKARLRTLKVALPSLELQNKFSRISEKYWKKQELLQEYKKQADNLFNSLLQRAFRGEL